MTFLAGNLLESSLVTSITTTAMLAANPKTRLYDRDRGAQGTASAAGQFDIDLVLSSAQSASALGVVNHNRALIEVYGDTASAIGTTLVASLDATGVDPFLGTWASASKTKWRIRFLAYGGTAFAAGEVLLGVARTVANPRFGTGKPQTIGNTVRELSKGGFAWGVKFGDPRVGLPTTWLLTDADLTIFETMFGECNEGADNLLVSDSSSVLRWMFCTFKEIKPIPRGGVGGNNEFEAGFEESL